MKVLAICGSTRADSSNLQLIKAFVSLTSGDFVTEIYSDLQELPHFNPDLDNDEKLPPMVAILRNKLQQADGIFICTPEYVFSLPGALKNAIEWTVSTTIFSDKPVALITASGMGEKAHVSLLLIMTTVGAKYSEQSQLLISGARTKVNNTGQITDEITLQKIKELITSFKKNMENK